MSLTLFLRGDAIGAALNQAWRIADHDPEATLEALNPTVLSIQVSLPQVLKDVCEAAPGTPIKKLTAVLDKQ